MTMAATRSCRSLILVRLFRAPRYGYVYGITPGAIPAPLVFVCLIPVLPQCYCLRCMTILHARCTIQDRGMFRSLMENVLPIPCTTVIVQALFGEQHRLEFRTLPIVQGLSILRALQRDGMSGRRLSFRIRR